MKDVTTISIKKATRKRLNLYKKGLLQVDYDALLNYFMDGFKDELDKNYKEIA